MSNLPPAPWRLLHENEIVDADGKPVAYVRTRDDIKRLFLATREMYELLMMGPSSPEWWPRRNALLAKILDVPAIDGPETESNE